MQRIRSALFVGFMVLLPLLVTVYLIQFIFNVIDRAVGGWVSRLLVQAGFALQEGQVIWFLGVPFQGRVPIIGVLLVIFILLLIGGLARTIVGRHVFYGIERLFGLIPVVRGVYHTVQQVSQAFVQEKSTFKQVVLVEYPRKGIFTMGFMTGDSQGDILRYSERDYINVFLPKSPNPTSGWMAIVPREEVTFLELSVEDGLKFIISGGVIPPPTGERKQTKQINEREGFHLDKRGTD